MARNPLFRSTQRVATILVATFFSAASSHALVIDGFDTPFGPASQGTLDSPQIIGGEADFVGFGGSPAPAVTISSGNAVVNAPSGGIFEFLYDGNDDNELSNALALGNIDLTQGGSQTAFQIEVLSVVGVVELYSMGATRFDGTEYSSIPFTIFINAPGTVLIPFSSLTVPPPSDALSGAGAINFSFGFDAGESISIGSFAIVPEPGSAALLGTMLMLFGRRRAPRG